MNRQGQDSNSSQPPRPPSAAAPPPSEKTPEEKAALEKAEADWWDNFRQAVEDPDASIYEFLRRNLLSSLELDEKAGLSDKMVQARRKALKELFEMADAATLAKRLALLENNTLLFNLQARIVMKVSRAVLETYVQARKQRDIGKMTPAQQKSAAGETLKKELAAAEQDVDAALGSVSRALHDKDEKEVAATIRKAAGQMAEERNINAMVRDAAMLARHYLTPDNLVNIAIIALPLVTWQYRWALALGLGAYSGRKSVYYGYQALNALRKGDKVEARAKGREALGALKEAGGKVLLITLTPALARYPALTAGFLGVFVEAAYKAGIEGMKKMLEEEEKHPGATPIGKRTARGIRNFFSNYQDRLTTLALGALKIVAPHRVTETMETVSKRMPLTKMRTLASRSAMIAGALGRRFNKVAVRRATAAMDIARVWSADALTAFGRAVTDPLVREQQREYERLAAREDARHEEEKEAELEAYREGAPSITADFEAEAAARTAAAQADAVPEAAADMTAEQKEALKKRKIESMRRHEKPAAKPTLKAKPD